MEPSVRALLDLYDDPVGCEFPENDFFRIEELEASVRAVQTAILDELHISMKRDGNVQDASYHDSLFVIHPESVRPRYAYVAVGIRFSNFGRLFSICEGEPEIHAQYPVDEIKALVTRHGWKFVDAEQLHEIYDGKNKALRDGRNTWWIRFFDYL